MAHAVKTAALTDGLVRSIFSQYNVNDERQISQARQITIRAIKASTHLRVNQFDVQARLDGLEEKFRVRNNEPLADALRARLDELSKISDRYTPDVLALLLEISDRPLENAKIADAEARDTPSPEPALTWAEILADDPLTEDGLWDDIEAGSTSSVFSLDRESLQEVTVSTEASSVDDDDLVATARLFSVTADHQGLRSLRAVRSQLEHGNSEYGLSDPAEQQDQILVSELQASRECLMMLQGLPTTIFTDIENGARRPKHQYRIASFADATSQTILTSFAKIADPLHNVQSWCQRTQCSPLLQRCQSAIQQRLSDWRKHVSSIEQGYTSGAPDTVVSIQDVLLKAQDFAEPITRISALLERLRAEDPPWQILEYLYEECCISQTTLNDNNFSYFAALFFECLPMYMEPIRKWVVEGQLDDNDDLVFIVSEPSHKDPGSLWHNRYSLRYAADGNIFAPIFIQTQVPQIFSAGKCVMFLRHLGKQVDDRPSKPSLAPLSYISNCEAGDRLDFSTFSDKLQQSLDQWVSALSGPKPVVLKHTLLYRHGLQDMMNAFHYVFLSKDGALFQTFADALFERIDKRPLFWADRFVLSEMVQNTLGSSRTLKDENISAKVQRKAFDKATVLDEISRLVIDYAVPWPIRNVTREASPSSCQRVFTLLLQVYRAKYRLRGLRLGPRQETRHVQNRLVPAVKLRQRLTWYVDTLNTHTCEIATISIRDLFSGFEKAADIDDMDDAYARFNSSLLQRLLLSDNLATIHKALYTILIVCEDFAHLWEERTKSHQTPGTQQRAAIASQNIDDTDSEDDEAAIISKDKTPTRSFPELQAEYERQLSFAVAGLRGISRAGGEQAWTILAERLDWGQDFQSG